MSWLFNLFNFYSKFGSVKGDDLDWDIAEALLLIDQIKTKIEAQKLEGKVK